MSALERAELVSERRFLELLRLWDMPGYLISVEISEFAQQLVASELAGKESWGELLIPCDAIRHSQCMIFGMQGETGEVEIYAIDERNDRPAGDPECIVLEWLGDKMAHLGNFTPGGVAFLDERYKTMPVQTQTEMAFIISAVAFILSIINQPNMTKRQPLVGRQQRRAAQRGGAKAVNAWHKVTWDIGKETVAKVSRSPDFHKLPLHWRRGHFRRAEEHYKGAIRRPDALIPEERMLWWQWIEGQWVGHPAFGVKRSIHAPRLTYAALAGGRAA